MIKKFILMVCGSFVGVTLALMVFTLVAVITSFAIMGSMGASSATKSVDNNSILHIALEGDIPERDGNEDFNVTSMIYGGQMPKSCASLETLKKAIENAANDSKVKGIYLECNGVDASPATLYELRKALTDFKKESKKFIYSYAGSGYDEFDYYLASTADSIFINPEGAVDIHGLGSVTPFFKKLLDKVGVKMQVVRVGTFKSAVEPYILDSISPANRLQTEHYLGQIWNVMSKQISDSRNITPERMKQLTDTVLMTLPVEFLKENKLVDGICYKTEMDSRLRQLTEVNESEDPKLVDPDVMAASADNSSDGKSEIAVLYAVGEIDGRGAGIDSEDIVEQLRKLQNDDDVVGVVLRVNSPGGSAYGSEQMWKAIDDLKHSGKTVAVSMGDYAASGGYYLSCDADRIFAEPVTITGSIGIFALIPDFTGLATDKLGVNFSVVKTNRNSAFGANFVQFTPEQLAALQNHVNRGYELFTKRCADGRHMKQDSIKKIAEGRVWDGTTALKIGLVDQMGGLEDAISYVAKKAKLADGDYHVATYPEIKNDWKKMIMQFGQEKAQAELEKKMGVFYTSYREVEDMLNRDRVLCLMPVSKIK